ncbi:MAG: lipopolysaccharide heptosyltransferase II [Nitrospinota bacterium]
MEIKNQIERILLIKPSSLGDIIHGLPVLKALHDKWPDAKISWAVKDIYADILNGNSYINELILLNKSSLTTSILPFRKKLRHGSFDLAVDMQGLFRSGLIAFLSGAAVRIGFSNARELASLFYTHKVDAPLSLHAVDRNLKLAASLGCEIQEIKFPLNLNPEAEQEALDFLQKNQLDTRRPLVTFVPGARWEKKRWPPASFSRLGDLLNQKLGAGIIVAGSRQENRLIHEIRSAMKNISAEAVDFSLTKLTALLSKSDAVVTNDSGPMHIAVAMGTPVVALFGPTDPRRTGPYTKKCLIIQRDLECRPCFRKQCSQGSFECMESISVEEVLEGVKKMLR